MESDLNVQLKDVVAVDETGRPPHTKHLPYAQFIHDAQKYHLYPLDNNLGLRQVSSNAQSLQSCLTRSVSAFDAANRPVHPNNNYDKRVHQHLHNISEDSHLSHAHDVNTKFTSHYASYGTLESGDSVQMTQDPKGCGFMYCKSQQPLPLNKNSLRQNTNVSILSSATKPYVGNEAAQAEAERIREMYAKISTSITSASEEENKLQNQPSCEQTADIELEQPKQSDTHSQLEEVTSKPPLSEGFLRKIFRQSCGVKKNTNTTTTTSEKPKTEAEGIEPGQRTTSESDASKTAGEKDETNQENPLQDIEHKLARSVQGSSITEAATNEVNLEAPNEQRQKGDKEKSCWCWKATKSESQTMPNEAELQHMNSSLSTIQQASGTPKEAWSPDDARQPIPQIQLQQMPHTHQMAINSPAYIHYPPQYMPYMCAPPLFVPSQAHSGGGYIQSPNSNPYLPQQMVTYPGLPPPMPVYYTAPTQFPHPAMQPVPSYMHQQYHPMPPTGPFPQPQYHVPASTYAKSHLPPQYPHLPVGMPYSYQMGMEATAMNQDYYTPVSYISSYAHGSPPQHQQIAYNAQTMESEDFDRTLSSQVEHRQKRPSTPQKIATSNTHTPQSAPNRVAGAENSQKKKFADLVVPSAKRANSRSLCSTPSNSFACYPPRPPHNTRTNYYANVGGPTAFAEPQRMTSGSRDNSHSLPLVQEAAKTKLNQHQARHDGEDYTQKTVQPTISASSSYSLQRDFPFKRDTYDLAANKHLLQQKKTAQMYHTGSTAVPPKGNTSDFPEKNDTVQDKKRAPVLHETASTVAPLRETFNNSSTNASQIMTERSDLIHPIPCATTESGKRGASADMSEVSNIEERHFSTDSANIYQEYASKSIDASTYRDMMRYNHRYGNAAIGQHHRETSEEDSYIHLRRQSYSAVAGYIAQQDMLPPDVASIHSKGGTCNVKAYDEYNDPALLLGSETERLSSSENFKNHKVPSAKYGLGAAIENTVRTFAGQKGTALEHTDHLDTGFHLSKAPARGHF